MNKRIRIICITLLVLSLISCGNKESPIATPVNDPELVNAAKLLPTTGKLHITNNGYVYLKVSDDYYKILYPILIKHLNTNDSKCLTPDHSSLGSHISVFYTGELSQYALESLPIGKEFDFRIIEIEKIVTKKRWHQQLEKTVWYAVLIDSAELSSVINHITMTKFYKLPPFHISFAVAKFNPDGGCIRYRSWD